MPNEAAGLQPDFTTTVVYSLVRKLDHYQALVITKPDLSMAPKIGGEPFATFSLCQDNFRVIPTSWLSSYSIMPSRPIFSKSGGVAYIYKLPATLMSIISIFKRRKTDPPEMKPAAMLRLIQEYVPEYYRNSKHFKDSKEFLEHSEWGLALESLIEMANETGHYFSETFWLDLAICAEKMQMTEQADYCRNQVIRNEKGLGTKTPNGWTTIKLDGTHFELKLRKSLKTCGQVNVIKKTNLKNL